MDDGRTVSRLMAINETPHPPRERERERVDGGRGGERCDGIEDGPLTCPGVQRGIL